MFTSVDTLANDLQLYSAGNDHFAMYRIRNTEVGRAILQLAGGKRPEALGDDGDIEELKGAAVKFVRDVMLSPSSDHYALLGVSIDADSNAIREQFRRLMGLVHPDARPVDFPPDAATRVNRAYAVLAEAESRATYKDELFGTAANTSITRPRGVTTSASADRASHPGFGARLAGLAQVFRSRSTLLWLALLLVVPLGAWVVSLFSQDAPARLVEARPKPQGAYSMPGPATSVQTLPPVVSAPVVAPPEAPVPATAAGDVEKKSARAEKTAASMPAAQPRGNANPGPAVAPRAPATLMSNQLSERSLALTARPTPRASTQPLAVPAHVSPSSTSPPPSPDTQVRPAPARDLAPVAAAAAPPLAATSVAANTPAVAPPSARNDSPTRSENSARVRTADADEILVRFTNAYESGSINGFAQLLSPGMSGRRQMLSDYERVFSATRQRSIKFNQLKHTPAGDRVATSGYATVTTVDQDNRTTTQRVFLEFEIGRDRGEPRIERLANYVIH